MMCLEVRKSVLFFDMFERGIHNTQPGFADIMGSKDFGGGMWCMESRVRYVRYGETSKTAKG